MSISDQPAEVLPPSAESLPLTANANVAAFEWTPVNVAKWAGKNFAGGVVGTIGGMAFSSLWSAVHNQRDYNKEILAKLDDVLVRLDDIKRQLDVVTALSMSILSGLDALRTAMNTGFAEAEIDAAYNAINDAFGRPAQQAPTATRGADKGLTIWSFTELLDSFPDDAGTAASPPKVLMEEAVKWGKEVESGKWNLSVHVTAIHKALTGNLLKAWADALIVARDSGTITTARAASVLESRFLEVIEKQLLAVAMRCAVCGLGGSEVDTKSLEKLLRDAGRLMDEESRFYLSAVERLVCSEGNVWPVPSLPDVGPGAFGADAEAILLRADLVAETLRLVGKKAGPEENWVALRGVYGRAIVVGADARADVPPLGALAGGGDVTCEWGATLVNRHAIHLFPKGDKLMLEDHYRSQPRIARYRWRSANGTSELAVGVTLDQRYRYGVRTAEYDVFGEGPKVIAAGYLDTQALHVGAPEGTPVRATRSGLDNAPPHMAVEVRPVWQGRAHLLDRNFSRSELIYVNFHFARAWNGGLSGGIELPLFRYEGDNNRRVRLSLRCTCSVWVTYPGEKSHRNNMELETTLSLLSKPDTGAAVGREIYKSVNASEDLNVYLRRVGLGYHATVQTDFPVDIELSSHTDYSLVLTIGTWTGRRHEDAGWKNVGTEFKLSRADLQWIR